MTSFRTRRFAQAENFFHFFSCSFRFFTLPFSVFRFDLCYTSVLDWKPAGGRGSDRLPAKATISSLMQDGAQDAQQCRCLFLAVHFCIYQRPPVSFPGLPSALQPRETVSSAPSHGSDPIRAEEAKWRYWIAFSFFWLLFRASLTSSVRFPPVCKNDLSGAQLPSCCFWFLQSVAVASSCLLFSTKSQSENQRSTAT